MTSKNLQNEISVKHINILAIFKNEDLFYEDYLHKKIISAICDGNSHIKLEKFLIEMKIEINNFINKINFIEKFFIKFKTYRSLLSRG